MSSLFEGYRFFRSLRLVIGAVLFLPIVFIFLGSQLYEEYSNQQRYRQQYGGDWKAQYENHFGAGSLQKAQGKMIAGSVGLPAIATIAWLLYRQATGSNAGNSRPQRRKSHRQNNKW